MNYVVTVGVVLALSFALMRRERYRTLQSAYKYAFVDTNPARAFPDHSTRARRKYGHATNVK